VAVGWRLAGSAVSSVCARLASTMAPFPPAPLRFRTAGFPRYGSKTSLSDGTFRHGTAVKPASRHALAPVSFVCVLRALQECVPDSPLCVGAAAGWSTAVRARQLALPQGPSLRSGLCCPGPSTLSRPHAPHSQAHRDFAALRLIRDAFAVRARLGCPRVVPCFRIQLLVDMSFSTTPESSRTVLLPASPVRDTGLRPSPMVSALSMTPQIHFTWDPISRLPASLPLQPADLLASLVDLTEPSVPPTETFTPELSDRVGRPSRRRV
jgi:hypothetical protein